MAKDKDRPICICLRDSLTSFFNELRQISDKGWNEFSALGKVIRGLRHKHIKKLNTSSKALAEKAISSFKVREDKIYNDTNFAFKENP